MTTLRKIQYSNLNQFLTDLNSNFAQIENSPLYKGIPGTDGTGIQGLRGIRGTQFLFVNYANFLIQFPNELVNQSSITLEFLNQKLLSFTNKQKLFNVFGISEFVNNDIVVLTNSIMLSYDLSQDKFINTTLAFNEQSNLASSIQNQIEQYVQYYIDNNQILLNLHNIFEKFSTLAKNYTDNNSTFITNQQTASSVYSPFIAGYTTNNGISVIDHKYFGFSDIEFPKTLKGSIVFGSMKKYIDLLMATTSTVQEQTLTSDYAPGATNIPSAIFLQDTVNAGLMFGYKNKLNLKSFGHIYKDIDDNIVIKSDSGILESEFSKLLINKYRLLYNKLTQFGDSLEVSKNISFGGNLNNKFLRTSQYTDAQNEYTIEIGHNTSDEEIETIQRNISKSIIYAEYTNNVLVTNENGEISHDYLLEDAIWNVSEELASEQIVMNPNSNKKFVTSNYLGFLIRKINNLNTFLSDNYWKKSEFNTGVIPNLVLNNDLTVNNEFHLGPTILGERIIETFYQPSLNKTLNLGYTTGKIYLRGNIYLPGYNEKVLITNSTGAISPNYSLEILPTILNEASINSETTILRGKHFEFLRNKILNFAENYWTKEEFETNVIPRIDISTTFNSPTIQDSSTMTIFSNENGNSFSHETAFVKFNSNDIRFDKFKSKVLVTGADSRLLSTYSLQTGVYDDKVDLEEIISYPSDTDKIVNSSYIHWLVKRINSLTSYISSNYWTKTNFITDGVSTIKCNFLTTNYSFNLANKLKYDLFLSDELNIGEFSETGTLINNYPLINFTNDNYKSKVFITDASGNLMNYKELSSLNIDTLNISVPTASTEVSVPIDVSSFNINNIINERQLKWVMNIINNIKTRFANTYNKTETDTRINTDVYEHVPVGSIILWDLTFDVDIPAGWVRCNGSAIPETDPIKYTQNMGEPFADCCYIMKHNI
jgi:hypothetical protein